MVDQILAESQSYVRNQESLTVITDNMTSSDTSFEVDDVTAISKGLVEIGDELVYVKSIDLTTGIATVLPGTRGYRSSDAVAHSINELVRNNPTFPRSQVARAVNETISAVDLDAVVNYDFVFDGTTLAYKMPAGTSDVISVSWEAWDSTGRWIRLKNFRLDRNYWEDGDTEASVALVLQECPVPGRTVRVQLLKGAERMDAPTDDFTTATGLPESCEDVIRLGAMWRLISSVDLGKVIATSPSADAMDVPVSAGRASEVSKYLYQLYSTRLAEERGKQADLFTDSISYQR